MHEKILIIDDEDDIRLLIQGLLEDEGYQVFGVSNSDQAYEIIEQETPGLIIQDIWLQGSQDDGIEILKKVKESHIDLPFLMISGHGTIETAVSAIKMGAYDFIEKPFKSDRLLLMIQRALENANLKQQNTQLKQIASKQNNGIAEQIPENILQTLDKVARTNSRVLITGETGTGKNISAQYIHDNSDRCDKPFMALNCASTDSEKLEAELFGGVNSSNVGLLELVNGGTLLLDEVACLSADMQGKLLHLLQEASYFKVGSNNKIPLDIRVIATSSKDIDSQIVAGFFREDLYYRLNVVPINMRALRKRKLDIPTLISRYSNNEFSEIAMAKLQSYSWPGNLKQLHNVLDWVSIMNENKVIEIENLPPELSGKVQDIHSEPDESSFDLDVMLQLGLREARECFERHYLLSQVNKFDGNISKTSEFIGMERSALHRKLKSLEVLSDDKKNVA